MRHFFRTHVEPAEVMRRADDFFQALGMRSLQSGARARTFQGVIGTPESVATMRLTAKPEGGHYTFVEVATDQMGESRLDRNVKRFFVGLKNTEEPRRTLEASY
ncbi:MAG: hypothetical protein U0132_21110 [Gemmatimonadaceae bacterium]